MDIDPSDVPDRQPAAGIALGETITCIAFDFGALITRVIRDINSRRN